LALGALGVPLVARELDLPILLLAAGNALLVAGFLSQLGQRGQLSLSAGARRAFWVLVNQLPLASALLVGVLSVGTARAGDFSLAEHRTLQTITEQLSLALANLLMQETQDDTFF